MRLRRIFIFRNTKTAAHASYWNLGLRMLAGSALPDKAGEEETRCSRKDHDAELNEPRQSVTPPHPTPPATTALYSEASRAQRWESAGKKEMLSWLQGQKKVTPLIQGETLELQNQVGHRWRSCQCPVTCKLEQLEGEELLLCSVVAQSQRSPSDLSSSYRVSHYFLHRAGNF